MANNYAYSGSSSQYRQLYTSWLTPNFKAGDYAITLTFRETFTQYRSWYKPDYELYAKHVHHYLNVVNRAFLGSMSKNGKHKLKCAYVFEQNSSQGVHAHMILEKPHDKRIAEDNHKLFLRFLWTDLKYSGLPDATDVQEIHEVKGWLNYMFKDLHKSDAICTTFNVNDWHLNNS